jgi:cellobiose phosphorylase
MIKIKRIARLNGNEGHYFPLFNLHGLKSAITPFFAGDLKLDHHHYLLEPCTEIDLVNPTFSRNVHFKIDDETYFWNGQTERQQQDELTLETGLLYQKVVRKNPRFSMETTSYVDWESNVERHEIRLTNLSSTPFSVQALTATPFYGRSADNLRDHRHVTSLLHRVETVRGGILLCPTLSFDERGHTENHHVYGIFASSPNAKIRGYIPVLDDFIGDGSLAFPHGGERLSPEGTRVNGYEAIGAIAFESVTLKENQSLVLYLSLGIHLSREEALRVQDHGLDPESFQKGLRKVNAEFERMLGGLRFSIADAKISDRLGWVTLQPILRRNFGNSFLPHHDYGRGGKGWRDLWQDLLSLIQMNDPGVSELLFNNFQGIRMDGSNATIIGDRPGEFKADRNQITRVWSDHAAWPLWTTKMYIDETGDSGFLLRRQTYFMDQFTHYSHRTRPRPAGERQTLPDGSLHEGTILEHLLLENLVGHHNTGEHGFVRLEDADWNDGLDMASNRGETVAFTHMYARNLLVLSRLIRQLPVKEMEVFADLTLLLDEKADLVRFFDRVSAFSGEKMMLNAAVVASTLERLGNARIAFLRNQAFRDGKFISYFDNDGQDADTEATMSLTGQAMALLNETATPSQAKTLAETTRKMLFDANIGGYRLNSDYHQIRTRLGRAFGFAYGHKENGAVFSHMVVMYAFGLYRYGLVHEGREAVMTLLGQAENPHSHVWAGIPEYFNDRGIGKYCYLTGSASWILYWLRTEVFGIRFEMGVMHLDPKLCREDFIEGKASIQTVLFGKKRTITYLNPRSLDFGSYRIEKILMSGREHENRFSTADGDIEVYLNEIL